MTSFPEHPEITLSHVPRGGHLISLRHLINEDQNIKCYILVQNVDLSPGFSLSGFW